MLEYGNLSPLEFEYVCQDVMQAKLGTALRRFPAGRDDGIDLIDDLETNHIVVQVQTLLEKLLFRLEAGFEGGAGQGGPA